MNGTPAAPIRLVWRVRDMTMPAWPGVITSACHRCGEQVHVDTTQAVPPAFAAAKVVELVCVPCALTDPRLRPEVLAMHQAVRKLGAAQALAETLNKAGRRRRRA